MAFLAAASAFIYILLTIKGWTRQVRRSHGSTKVERPVNSGRPQRTSPEAPPRAYFWGLTFAVLFYYGFLIWWGRYGLGRAAKLTLLCIVAVGLVQILLRSTGMIDIDGIGESFAVGLLIAVPIRALAGIYVARYDNSWRSEIVAQRRMCAQSASEDA